jgi:hypothetical protein
MPFTATLAPQVLPFSRWTRLLAAERRLVHPDGGPIAPDTTQWRLRVLSGESRQLLTDTIQHYVHSLGPANDSMPY